MIQTNLDATIWTQDNTSKILPKRSRIATFDPAEVLHEAHGKIIYFGDCKLFCVVLALSC
jgi:predicted oxidoreductase (fatty acid repression mutant protein)